MAGTVEQTYSLSQSGKTIVLTPGIAGWTANTDLSISIPSSANFAKDEARQISMKVFDHAAINFTIPAQSNQMTAWNVLGGGNISEIVENSAIKTVHGKHPSPNATAVSPTTAIFLQVANTPKISQILGTVELKKYDESSGMYNRTCKGTYTHFLSSAILKLGMTAATILQNMPCLIIC